MCSVAQSCLTLCDPMNCSQPGPSFHGILQERLLEQVAISDSSWISHQGSNILFCISCTGRHILYTMLSAKPLKCLQWWLYNSHYKLWKAEVSTDILNQINSYRQMSFKQIVFPNTILFSQYKLHLLESSRLIIYKFLK